MAKVSITMDGKTSHYPGWQKFALPWMAQVSITWMAEVSITRGAGAANEIWAPASS
jgi:hypothetical protein